MKYCCGILQGFSSALCSLSASSSIYPPGFQWVRTQGITEVTDKVADAFKTAKCSALIDRGSWLDHSVPRNWQPDACMLRNYQKEDTSNCLGNQRTLFVGDSTVRQVFDAVAKTVNPEYDLDGEKHENKQMLHGDVQLFFYWDPYLNNTGASSAIEAYTANSLVVMGAGLWHIRYEDPIAGFGDWQSNIRTLLTQLRATRSTAGMVLVMPIVTPAFDRLDVERHATITPERVQQVNDHIAGLPTAKGLHFLRSFASMGKGVDSRAEDGLHALPSVVAAQANTVLNLRCNNALPKKFPMASTCCFEYPQPSGVQSLGIILSIFLVIYVALRTIQDANKNAKEAIDPTYLRLRQLAILAGVGVLCYLCDRTHVFGKEGKQYDVFYFVGLSVTVWLAGFLTLSTTTKEQPMLARDQTDEWKGWMQLMILIYHYLGASGVTGIYNYIRVCVASYLFMTGFGHTIFFYKKGDFGYKRVAAVMVRLNLLTCLLAYVMDTDYLFYYFAPLVSFWFMFIYLTMWIGNKYNQSTEFITTKILLCSALAYALVNFYGPFETIFYVLEKLFHIHWNLTEWRFRVALDMWIVPVGMLFSILFLKAQEHQIDKHEHWEFGKQIGLLLCNLVLVVYTFFEVTFDSKIDYNRWHPIVSAAPILAFVFLRNGSSYLRRTHSRLFAFIGQCSLETFILQYHIWLAADTKGLLFLGLGSSRLLNFGLTTPIFIYLSHYTARATAELTDWVMGVEKKKVEKSVDLLLPRADAAERAVGGVAEAVPLNGAPAPPATIEGTTLQDFDAIEEPLTTAVPKRTFATKLALVAKLVFQDLRVRLGALLGLMWFLNLVSG